MDEVGAICAIDERVSELKPADNTAATLYRAAKLVEIEAAAASPDAITEWEHCQLISLWAAAITIQVRCIVAEANTTAAREQ